MDEREKQTLLRLALTGAEEVLPRQLTLLGELCAQDSGTGLEAGNEAVRQLLRPLLEELGAQIEEVPAPGLGKHLVARVRPEGPVQGRVLLAAHLDTVFGLGAAAE